MHPYQSVLPVQGMLCCFFDGGDFAFFLDDEAPGSGLIFLKGQQHDIVVVLGKGRHERPEVGEDGGGHGVLLWPRPHLLKEKRTRLQQCHACH
jgi:hypothetical protein